MKDLFVYIMTNHLRTTVYIGVTNDLARRVWEHQNGEIEGFTKEYRLTILVYYEVFPEARAAIAREKQLKNWRRTKKDALLNSMNPEWRDLSIELFGASSDRRGPSTPLHSARDDSGRESVHQGQR
jgi:putative endonuclease